MGLSLKDRVYLGLVRFHREAFSLDDDNAVDMVNDNYDVYNMPQDILREIERDLKERNLI